MPYTAKQKRFFHANVGKKGITPAMVAEADASATLPPKRAKKTLKRKGK